MTPQALDVFTCPLDGVRLVEASAGTGKTWNICGLYLRLVVEQELDVQKLLVVTFTNAATAELKDRIRGRLAEVLQALQGGGPKRGDPFADTLVAAWERRGLPAARSAELLERALRHFDEASIFTIHGFCKRALDDAAFAAGVPLRQDLLEDDSQLRQEVANDFWRRDIASGALPAPVVRWMALRKDTPLRLSLLLKRHSAKSTARVLWPEGLDAAPAVDPAAYAQAFAQAREAWLRDRAAIVKCVLDSLESLPANIYRSADSVQAAAVQWDAVFASSEPLACPADTDDKRLEKIGLLASGRYKAKSSAKKPCLAHPFFDLAQQVLDAWDELGRALKLARLQVLRRFVQEAPAELRERKRRRRLVAFDDMLLNLDLRLRHETAGEALAQALRQKFPAALIDEFQDTDPLQFSVFHRVWGGRGPMFLVGDPKQAIYSFRNADLHTYLSAAKTADARYSLAQNQRSVPALIDGLNALFGANPRAFMLEGLGYEAVKPGSRKRAPFDDRTGQHRSALHLWELPMPEGAGLPKSRARQLAIQACAGEIARLLAAAQAGHAALGKDKLEARDIAVLVRSHREGSDVRAALAALGVGSVEVSQASVFGTPDAEELERVLAAVLDAGREGLLKAALATELFGADATAIQALGADEVALAEVAARLRRYLRTWIDRGVGPMLRELAVTEGVAPRMLARPDGERRLTNFRHLAEALHEAAGDHAGPEALLRWLRNQRGQGGSESAQVRLESDSNLVQIVTIHKSKGLEYPVVFCPSLWDGRARAGSTGLPGCEYHDADGQPVIDYRELAEPEASAVKACIDLEAVSESVRLIYVALTRAVHRCYVVVGPYLNGNKSPNECTRGALNWLVGGRGSEPLAWRKAKGELAAVRHAWSALAKGHAEVMTLEALPQQPGQPVTLPRPAPESIEALSPPARIPWGWQLASYSSLAHGARLDEEAGTPDHDELAGEPDTAAKTDDGVPQDDILRFDRGARAGETMHDVFERIDFGDPSQWPQRVREALASRPPQGTSLAHAQAMFGRMAADVLATPLPGGVVLSQVRRRIAELEFAMTAPALAQERLASVLRRHGYPAIEIGQAFLSGYLHGFIDLVFEQGGRYHVLDWKSSHLGWRPQDYGQPQLARHMREEGYHLQYLLYTVAVHRWLRSRLPGYRYDDHFGGVYYLFVRGVRPDWVLEDGSAAGVFHDRPPRELVEALDAALEGKSA